MKCKTEGNGIDWERRVRVNACLLINRVQIEQSKSCSSLSIAKMSCKSHIALFSVELRSFGAKPQKNPLLMKIDLAGEVGSLT